MAQKHGTLNVGNTIVEASGGNASTSLAMIGAAKGYKTLMVMNAGCSIEKQKLSELYGSEKIIVPGVPFTD